jgi:D-alanyl-D-alanine carboxypeptidase (penicillin-binding protein 5/6)
VYGRRRRRAVLVAVLALLLACTAFAAARHPLNDRAPVLIDQGRSDLSTVRWPQSGQAAFVLGSGRPAASPDEQPVAIASLAKVMTAYVTLERYRNNIAQLLAAQVAGSQTGFTAEMNAEARALGMDHTIYTDPGGFAPSTVSTAADQLRVFHRAMRFPVFRQIVSMPSVTLPVAGTLTNFNPLIAEGYAGKTGSDSAAEGCLAFFTSVTANGRRLTAVGVVLGQGQGSDTSALLAAAGEAATQLVQSVA